ncbi:MAG: putative dehydrogenase, partial [Frankiales bacterium]|nr:putative dehydrogenase [Frankiales bacterium]
MAEVRTFCRVCNAACGIVVTVTDGTATDGTVTDGTGAGAPTVQRVIGDRHHPVSAGYSCAKGRALPALHHHPDRLEQPLLRVTGAVAEAVSWDVLLDDLGDRLRGILRTHGPEGIAVYVGTASAFDATAGRAAGQFLRAIGSRQKYSSLTVDSVAKALVAELLGGWSGLVPVWDEQRCGLLLLIGINPVVSHGHSNGISNPRTRLRAQAARGELWVVDPRRTESAHLATRHLQSRPGSDHVLVGHLVRELLRDGADEEFLAAHAVDVAGLAAAVEPYDSHRTARETGLPAEAVADLLAAVRRAGRISVLTGTGVDMSAAGNVTEWLVWALGVVTGSFDRPGGMWFNPGYLVRSDLRPRPPAPPEGKVRPGPASRPHLVSRFGERPAAALVPEIEAGNVAALV